jgi:uncharacterized protein YceH (UPF0502 family)
MVDFPSVDDVQEQLAVLAEHPDGLARPRARRPGQKEDRWQQIVAAPWGPHAGSTARVDADEGTPASARGDQDELGPQIVTAPAAEFDLLVELEAVRSALASLRTEVATIRQDLDALRQGLGG